ncbi:MAG: hypothetical protein K6E74_01415 [Bacilli bacterium]|nr:hypothetical protein [Bacilli bacterium]
MNLGRENEQQEYKESLIIKLNDEIFDEIRETESFKKIMDTALNYVK